MADVKALLGEGRVEEAVGALLEAIESTDAPDAHELLGSLCYADDDWAGARQQWEIAFRRYKELGERRRAARVAGELGALHWGALGNHAAGRGWLSRADRLLEGEGRCVERGYVLLAVIACEATDLDALAARADEALSIALELGDPDLEVRALADSGYALVAKGRTAEGFARLDEAMAALTAGEVHDLGMAATSFCAMLSACDHAGSPKRAGEWTRLVAELLLDRLGGRPKILHTHCRLAYGSVLCGIGRWTEGEAALLEARQGGADNHRADAHARLAHLRVLQGRVDEAAELLRGFEDRATASLPLAHVHLARGEHDLAAAALQRGLDAVVGDRLREGGLLAALVEAELGRDVDRAASAAERLAVVADACDTPSLRAEAALAAGRVAAARGEPNEAAALLATAQRHLEDDERPLLCGTILFERARALTAAGDKSAAVTDARAAMAVFERLGAQPHVDRTAALLRSLGAPGARPRVSLDDLTAREHDVLELLRQGLTNAEIGGRLYISPKTVEHHVSRVLTKLGVRSRAEAAAVAASVK